MLRTANCVRFIRILFFLFLFDECMKLVLGGRGGSKKFERVTFDHERIQAPIVTSATGRIGRSAGEVERTFLRLRRDEFGNFHF
jgi:hypothetical protein